MADRTHPVNPAAQADVERLLAATHDDPFAVLGPHASVDGALALRVLAPGARAVFAIAPDGRTVLAELALRDPGGFFEGPLPPERGGGYRLRIRWPDGVESLVDDPYRFGPVLGELDAWLLAEGTHLRPIEALGAAPCVHAGTAGTRFAVWAPNAARVSVVGEFNAWDGRRHPMRLRRECGVWELFLPGVGEGALYRYEIRARDGRLLPAKADPCALRAELRPATASIVAPLPSRLPPDASRRRANAADAPISIYEVHVGSWRRPAGDRHGFLDWDALADTLLPYVADLGFTHVELLPISEHPFDGSWGYQPTGLYAPSARFGEPAGLRRFVARAHALGIGVLLDWVPAHFPDDPHALAGFDGTALYEHADPREGRHADWGTLIYNLGRTEVRNFLIGNALYWLERYGLDGLRVDAVASMLYRDYSRAEGQWLPNRHGGRENLEAIDFLKRLNTVLGAERPQAITIAEESTAFPGVSRPAHEGGLGFHYKWNMGWMNDTLAYIGRDPIHRSHHHGQLTFGPMYAFSERFVLPLSHDEVVHGKGSLLGRMPGERGQRFANLRAYLGFLYGHPGKKLLFMGGEFGQWREWDHDGELDWGLLEDPAHAGVQRLVRDLNRLYRELPALHALDAHAAGFEWLDHRDAAASVIAFARRDAGAGLVAVVCNFTPVIRPDYRIGVPAPGVWRERINTDSAHYGGGNIGSPWAELHAQPVPAHGRPWSIALTLPPLATLFLEHVS
jgi:1,4-alpha-glucan branching enzyme